MQHVQSPLVCEIADTFTSLDFGPFLPNAGYELFGQGDLKITGPHPTDASGLADVWVGAKDDVIKVAVKSPGCDSSSNSSFVHSVNSSAASMCFAC